MLVEVIVDRQPYVGKRGDVKNIPSGQARALIALGKVRAAELKEPEVKEEETPKRVYVRRDMQAEDVEAKPRRTRRRKAIDDAIVELSETDEE